MSENNAFDGLFNWGKKKDPPAPEKKVSKKKRKPKESKPTEQQDPVGQNDLKTDTKSDPKNSSNTDRGETKKASDAETGKRENATGPVNKQAKSGNGGDSEWETDDVLVEILVAAEQRRKEPLSEQNMAVDVFGKTPPPTVGRRGELM
uniref:Uncharacterized protein n=1 Tax=Plectus sambesii TaxID=2011161 RepID=A0A914URB6_9BILA